MWINVYNQGNKEYFCIKEYKEVKNPELWNTCPKCGLLPLVWNFDNGRKTACGCGLNEFNHLSICAESIMSYYTRNHNLKYYNDNELLENWNYYCKTGEDLFEMKKEELKNKGIKIW